MRGDAQVDCYYINLETAVERRQQIEANFSVHGAPGWTLTRFAATDAALVADSQVPGTLTSAEKACFLSHRALLRSLQDAVGPVMILEDDAIIGRHACALIDTLIANPRTPPWDLLFTNLSGLSVNTMLELARYRATLAAKGEISLLDLKTLKFHGATAYVVNPRSIAQVGDLLAAEETLDTPFDVLICRLIHASKLRGLGLFPFVTSLSDLNLDSQIRRVEGRSADRVWHAFSRMIWVDRDPGEHAALREAIMPFWRDEKGEQIEALFAAIESGGGEYP